MKRSTNQFTKYQVPKSKNLFAGDNTSGDVFGGVFETFGQVWGDGGRYGGFVHFRNRATPTKINH